MSSSFMCDTIEGALMEEIELLRQQRDSLCAMTYSWCAMTHLLCDKSHSFVHVCFVSERADGGDRAAAAAATAADCASRTAQSAGDMTRPCIAYGRTHSFVM